MCRARRVFCLLGRSGTGKSVTLKHVIGLLRPDSGRVFVEGEDVTALEGRELSRARQRMGFLFQHAALFDSLTVGENVAFPLRRHRRDLSDAEIRRIALEKLDQVGLAADYHKMPAALSGGMRKRAGLARAMALDPAVLLVDEPSAGLDPITSAEIDALLLDLKQPDWHHAAGGHAQHSRRARDRRPAGPAPRGTYRRPRHAGRTGRELSRARARIHELGGRWMMPSSRLIAIGVFVIGGLVALRGCALHDRRAPDDVRGTV